MLKHNILVASRGAKISGYLGNAGQDWFNSAGEFIASPQSGLGRMAAQKEVVSIVDLRSEIIDPPDDPLRHATVELGGVRSLVGIPMLAGDQMVGAFTIFRHQIRPFTDDITRLASIFADQSVIAIQNARLISALRKANRAKEPSMGLI